MVYYNCNLKNTRKTIFYLPLIIHRQDDYLNTLCTFYGFTSTTVVQTGDDPQSPGPKINKKSVNDGDIGNNSHICQWWVFSDNYKHLGTVKVTGFESTVRGNEVYRQVVRTKTRCVRQGQLVHYNRTQSHICVR